MYKVATIFAFLFLLSCTVTKRVHRPGYHIEWRKAYKTQKPSEKERETRKVEHLDAVEERSDSNEEEKGQERIGELAQQNQASFEDEVLLDDATFENDTENEDVHSTDQEKSKATFFIEKTRKYSPFKIPKSKKRSGSYASDGMRNFAFLLLAFGGFVLLGSLFSFLGLWFLENLFYSLVFSGNGIIAGILGFLLFLVLLLLIYIAYAFVRYVLGGAYVGFIVFAVCTGVGLLCLLLSSW